MEKKNIRLMKPWFPVDTQYRIQEILDSGWIAGGELANEFAQKVAKLEGYEYGVATNSCSSALLLAIKAIPFEGMHIVIPDITYPATATAVFMAGYLPRIRGDPFLLDMPVDLFGLKTPDRNTGIIVDAACSLGSKSMSDKQEQPSVACYSFHPRKVITTGEGGMVCTSNEQIYDNVLNLVYHGRKSGFNIGYNLRMSDLNAVVGLEQLRLIDKILADRRRLVDCYNKYLPSSVKVFGQKKRRTNPDYNYQSLVIELPDSYTPGVDVFIERLKGFGVECCRGTSFLHNIAYYKRYLDPYSKFPEPLYVTLPLHHFLETSDIMYVCEAIDHILYNYDSEE